MAVNPMAFMGAGTPAAPASASPLAGFLQAQQAAANSPAGFMPQAQSQAAQQPNPAELQAAAQQQAALEQLAAAQPAQNNGKEPDTDARADMERQSSFNSPVHAHADNSEKSAASRDGTAAEQESGSGGMIGGDSAAGQGRTAAPVHEMTPRERIRKATARAQARMTGAPQTPGTGISAPSNMTGRV